MEASPIENPKSKIQNPVSCLPIVLAFGLAVLIFAVLFVLTSGAILPAAIAAGVIFGVAAMHYVVWGWWLSGVIRRQVDEEQREKP
ncbi:MAG: hypothetical protein ACREJM_13575 [Candidatus Saccharimonadales bacterium]